MTHDVGDRPDPAAAPVGRWRLLGGNRRLSRATAVAPVDETTVDMTEFAYERMLTNTEQALEAAANRLLAAQAKTEAVLARLADRRHWAGMTADHILAELKHEVFEVHVIVTGKAK